MPPPAVELPITSNPATPFSEPLENCLRSSTSADAADSGGGHVFTFETDPAVHTCPEWIALKLGLHAEEVSRLEVTSSSIELYYSLLEYFAHRAVDISEKLPRPREEVEGEKPPLTEREYTGRLTTLCQTDGIKDSSQRNAETFRVKEDEDDSETDSDSEAEATRSIIKSFLPHVFRMGLGFAHVEAPGGEEVFVHHYTKGLPLSIDGYPKYYRSVLIYARTPEVTKALSEEVCKWKKLRSKRRVRKAVGKFELFRFVTCGNGRNGWTSHGLKPARSLSSIILPTGRLDSIVDDFKEFDNKETRKWYQDHGLPYRRSYLFYGPPGVGKTSTIRALAGALHMPACFLGMTQTDFSNQALQDAVAKMPKPGILVFEDVDVFFNEQRQSKSSCPLTFSGMLNVLDGLMSSDGILTIMTTNHIEKLDPALIRAGRVDRRFEFPNPSRQQIADFFLSFYPQARRELADKFANVLFRRPEKEARSIASLQQHFIFTRRSSAEECIAAIPKFFDEFYPYSGNDIGHPLVS